MHVSSLDKLRHQLSVESKNGIDFTLAGTVIWAIVAFIWTIDTEPYNKSIFVFIAGGPLLPLAFLLSKIVKSNWKIKDNPLQPLGLWLNLAQLFYFPVLIFILIKYPDYFLMTYAIITGAHFFPYAWFYKTIWYAIFAGLVSIGSLLLTLLLKTEQHFYVGVWTSICLLVLSLLLTADYKKKEKPV